MTRLWFKSALLRDGWASGVLFEIADGVISRIASDTEASAGDERHAVALPGLPNLHSHAFQRGMAGLAEVRGPTGDSFWTWREMMYRFVDRIDPEDLEAIAALAYMEMLEAGFTRVGEFHYIHHGRDGTPYDDIGELATRIAAAASETGIALTLLPVFYAHGGFGPQPPNHGQRRFINNVDRFARLMDASARAIARSPEAVLGLAPHSLRAATAEEIAAISPMAKGGPIHIHIAEQTKEVTECVGWCGRRPVERLFDTVAVDERWCAIHATHMTQDETLMLARSGAVAGLCPITEANLADGVFEATAFAEAGGRYGVGSDSNILISAAEELRSLEYSQRLSSRARNVLALHPGTSTGRRLFDAAYAGGAQALGAPAGLTEGALADIVSLDGKHPAFVMRDADALLDGWIFAAASPVVDCVWRRGKKLVDGGRHHARERVQARFRRTLEKILS